MSPQHNTRIFYLTAAILAATSFMFSSDSTYAAKLENWQSCCGAVCLRTVAGLLGDKTELGKIRQWLKPNRSGETTLAEIEAGAEKMGFHTLPVRVKSDKLELCSAPLIAHKPPRHFVVLLGLGKKAGVLIIDPPHKTRKLTPEELDLQKYWNAIAIANRPFSIDDKKIGKAPTLKPGLLHHDLTKEYAGLTFINPVWFFGDANPGAIIQHTFLFRNTTTKPIALDKVQPNCSCVNIRSFTKIVPPREKGTLAIALDTTGMLGYITKSIAVAIRDAPKKKPLFLAITGEVSLTGNILLKPSEIYLPKMVKGSSVRKILTIRRIGYDNLNLRNIKCDSPIVAAKILPPHSSNSKQARVEVTIQAPKALGTFHYEITFYTDHPDYPTAVVPVYGNVVTHIRIHPTNLIFTLMAGNDKLKKTITVNSSTKKPFTITSAATDIDNIVASAKPTDEDHTKWQITLTNKRSLHSGIIKGNIFVETDDADTPRLSIPLSGLVISSGKMSEMDTNKNS